MVEPVVATEIPGYMSVVEPGVDSLTVRPKSPIALGEALTVLARDPLLRQRLAARGLVKAQRYAWRVIASQVLEVYQEARRVWREEHLADGASRDSKEVRRVHGPLSGVG